MPWITQRLSRPAGFYYSAIYRTPTTKDRTVTLGFLLDGVTTAGLNALLRAEDPDGRWTDALVVSACKVPVGDEDTLRGVLRAHRHFLPGTHAEAPAPTSPVLPPVEPLRAPKHPKGGLTLAEYVASVWQPFRATKCKYAKKEGWWWDTRILPVLGTTRLCDLDTKKWSAFLASLTVCGKSKLVVQGVYGRALRHAADLQWIDDVHKMGKIEGALKRSTPEPEPLSLSEVPRFLAGASTPTFRALFALHIGNGLRPSEVLKVRWEDLDLRAWRTIHVRGTKTALADAVVPLTPLSAGEMQTFWEVKGKPTTGYCFTFVESGLPFRRYPRSAFEGAAKRSGLNEGRDRDLFPYSCRHAFATIAAVSGIDRVFTKQMMRHSRHSTILEEAYEKVSKAEVAAAFAGFGMASK